MTAKECLRQAHYLDALINSDIREKEKLQKMMCNISSPSMDERVQTSRNTDAPYIRVLEKIMALDEKIAAEIEEMLDLKAKIQSAIKKLENPDEQLLLKYRYFEGCTWEEISIRLNTSVRTVHRIHASALKNFIVPD